MVLRDGLLRAAAPFEATVIRISQILKELSHFVRWAGRYPDPGFGKEAQAEEIFTLSEGHQVSAKELFIVAASIMGYASKIADEA